MGTRPTITIWRYALTELWRLVLLTTVVLVTVISFAAAVQPMAEGKLQPADALKFMFLAMVPMLQYALPFAAGFGATLAYHRMAQDNEVVASHAGGVSHRQILLPAIVSGLVLAGALSALNEVAIPRFLKAMQQMVTTEVGQVIVNTINRGEPLELKPQRMMIHADRAKRLGPDSASGAYERLLLTRIAAIEFDEQGTIQREVTADKAWVWLFPGRDDADAKTGGTTIRMVLPHVIAVGDGDFAEARDMPLVWAVPGAFNDDPKYLSWHALRQLRHDPDRMNWIDSRRRTLARHIAERWSTTTINDAMHEGGAAELIGAGRRLVVHGSGIRWNGREWRWDILRSQRDRPVKVELDRGNEGQPPVLLLAEVASMRSQMLKDLSSSQQLTFELTLERVTGWGGDDVGGVGGGGVPGGQRELLAFGDLHPAENPLDELLTKSSAELLAIAEPRVEAGDKFLAGPTNDLRDRIARLQREVTGKQNERVAMSVACFVMILTGAMSALRLRDSLPLTVYLWSFFPGLVTILTISAGVQGVEPMGTPGLLLLWGGVALFSVYAVVVYLNLRKH